MRRGFAVLGLAAALGCLGQQIAGAHASLRVASPLEGSTLGDAPASVVLSFRERPEPSLSAIRVLDQSGASYHIGRPSPVPGDPLSLRISVEPLDRGIYLVSWRILSAVDGHATSGVYAFGVRTSPAGAAAAAVAYPPASRLEILARSMFLAGLVALLGAAAAGVAQFGAARERVVALTAWMIAAAGLLLLADAQRRTAGASFSDLLRTSIGRALVWRALALGAAGTALAFSYLQPRRLRAAMAGVALATVAAMEVHVAAGHAAAGRWPGLATVGAQTLHFAAVGCWFGGLAALLVGLRGSPPGGRAAAVRRFSAVAAASLCAVAATGTLRAFNEVTSWDDLSSTGYGRLLVAKTALFAVLAAIGAFNRWWSVPVVATAPRLLHRAAGSELVLATGALVATAFLGTLPPPAAGALTGLVGLSASGSDFATTVRVELTAASDQPGANRFVVRAVDYDSNTPVRARRVSLRFTPLDDPGVESTSLDLQQVPEGSFEGSGPNMEFDGRWRVVVLIERAGDSAEVPLELETRIAPRWISTRRPPGRAPSYTVEMMNQGLTEFIVDPERAGPSTLSVSCFDFLGDLKPIESMVVTAAATGTARQLRVRRVNASRFVADVELVPGQNRIAAVARTPDGTRLRAALVIDVPR